MFAFPTILAGISSGASLLSGAVGAIGALQQAANARAMGNYQAAVAARSAAIAEANALRAEEDARRATENAGRAGLAGQERARDQDLEARDQIDAIVAESATTGLKGRSQRLVVESLTQLAARDRERLRAAGDAEAARFRGHADAFLTEAADLRSGAGAARADALMAKENAQAEAASARLGAFSSLLGGTIGAADTLLGAAQSSQAIRHDLTRVREWWARRFK